jgi:hypothetical protein
MATAMTTIIKRRSAIRHLDDTSPHSHHNKAISLKTDHNTL